MLAAHDRGPNLDSRLNDLHFAWAWTTEDGMHLHTLWQPATLSNAPERCRDCGMPIGVNYPAGRCPEHFTRLVVDASEPLCTKLPRVRDAHGSHSRGSRHTPVHGRVIVAMVRINPTPADTENAGEWTAGSPAICPR